MRLGTDFLLLLMSIPANLKMHAYFKLSLFAVHIGGEKKIYSLRGRL